MPSEICVHSFQAVTFDNSFPHLLGLLERK